MPPLSNCQMLSAVRRPTMDSRRRRRGPAAGARKSRSSFTTLPRIQEDVFRFARALILSKFDLVKFAVYSGQSMDSVQQLIAHHDTTLASGYHLIKSMMYRHGPNVENYYKELYRIADCCNRTSAFRTVYRRYVSPDSRYLTEERSHADPVADYLGPGWMVRPNADVTTLQEEKALLYFAEKVSRYFCTSSGKPLWLATALGYCRASDIEDILHGSVFASGPFDRRLATYYVLLEIKQDGGMERVGKSLRCAFGNHRQLRTLFEIALEDYMADSEMNLLPDKVDVLVRLGLTETHRALYFSRPPSAPEITPEEEEAAREAELVGAAAAPPPPPPPPPVQGTFLPPELIMIEGNLLPANQNQQAAVAVEDEIIMNRGPPTFHVTTVTDVESTMTLGPEVTCAMVGAGSCEQHQWHHHTTYTASPPPPPPLPPPETPAAPPASPTLSSCSSASTILIPHECRDQKKQDQQQEQQQQQQ